jgi:hypothetical protein
MRDLGVAFVSAITILPVTYFGFRQLLIYYHESKIGHPLIFTFWADTTAFPFALVASILVFLTVLVYLRRRTDVTEKKTV